MRGDLRDMNTNRAIEILESHDYIVVPTDAGRDHFDVYRYGERKSISHYELLQMASELEEAE